MSEISVKRGEIWLVKFQRKESLGTEVWKTRPAVVISADWQNAKSQRVVVIPFSRTFPIYEWEIPVELNNQSGKIMTDQVHSFDKKKRLVRKVGILSTEILKKVEITLQELLELGN
ncbi:MAG: type II toxin-antitoxin system PemK/MazF family toxin [Candidatus Moeniiplasma glomeromycotorum]|nr:type II toxin-antitoxin system PemK/MazF family toxin [Candidatus Moeniiplasma glomeromycotorum]